jgi:predicted metal-dependent hydrolase
MVLRRGSPRRMTKSEMTIEVAGSLIPVAVIRSSHRRRTIAVSVSAAGIRVQSPITSTDDQIVALLERRRAWIAGRIRAAQDAPSTAALADGSLVPFRGEDLMLRIEEGPGRAATLTRCDSVLLVNLPSSLAEGERPQAIHRTLSTWYRVQAADVFPALVTQWSSASGLVPARVLIRNQRRRWGSCSPDGVIRLNWRLILLSPRLADYVVVHELAHLRHRHHQAPFWDEVARLILDHRERRRALNAAKSLGYLFD